VNRQLADDLEAIKTLQQLGMLFINVKNREELVSEIFNAAVTISNADFGNIQTLAPYSSRLKIAAQRGVPQWWLDYWNNQTTVTVHATRLSSRRRVIVENVEDSPIFAGTEALQLLLRAGVRAVQRHPPHRP
jgi:hypothetical protein